MDVERNLRAPIIGVANVAAGRGDAHILPTVAVRTGDTAARERARFQREPADILITTPESLYLLLTSNAREALRSVETVIVDEIHALVPTKRGAHLALSLERLEHLAGRKLQRIGLSATQRPLDEVARFLGGAAVAGGGGARHLVPRTRPRRRRTSRGSAVGAAAPGTETRGGGAPDRVRRSRARAGLASGHHRRRRRAAQRSSCASRSRSRTWPASASRSRSPRGPAAQGPVRSSIWTAIHPRLVELVREHRSTLIFVNSRRIAERLAAALNELAGEPLARAHHGSLARAQRIEIEDALKAGRVRALVATSSLELGIDMGAVDLVIQIEAPPSVASGMQRIGRAGPPHRLAEHRRHLPQVPRATSWPARRSPRR